LNGWLDQTGDFAGLAALRYYAVYRALVRAKVAAIRLAQPGLTDVDRTTSRSQLGGYVSLANRLSSRGPSGIILMHGLSGSGKSSVGRRLSCDLGAVCLRSDIERKRSAGSDGAPSGQTDYSDAAIGETYQRLLSTTEMLLGHGLPVVVDATFLNQAYRRQFEELADRTGVQWAIVACDAPDAVLEERVKRRQAQGNDASDATVDVLRSQRKLIQPLTAHESAHTIRCDTSTAVDGKTLKESVAARLARS
jgi:predicted kinase